MAMLRRLEWIQLFYLPLLGGYNQNHKRLDHGWTTGQDTLTSKERRGSKVETMEGKADLL
jgi:hypothetical protein